MPFERVEGGLWRITAGGWSVIVTLVLSGATGVFMLGGSLWQLAYLNSAMQASIVDRGNLWRTIGDVREKDLRDTWNGINANGTRITKLESLAEATRAEQERRAGRLDAIEHRISNVELAMSGVDQIRETLREQAKQDETNERNRIKRTDELNANVAELNGTLDQLRNTLIDLRIAVTSVSEGQKRTNERLEDLLQGRLMPLNPFQAPQRKP